MTRPLVVLPKDVPQWDEADLRRALVHELEHVRRGDWQIQLIARGVCALYWFHPLAWVAWRRLSTGEGAPVLSMANRSDLSVRVRAVLDSTQLRGRAGRVTVAASIALATVGVAFLGPLSVVAVAQAPESSEIAELVPVETAGAEQSESRVIMRKLHRRNQSAIGEALIAAARGNQLEMVRFLLARGAEIDLGVKGDGTPLINAAREAELPVVQLLVERGADLNLGMQGDGNPLIHACEQGQLDVVKLLISRNANINARVWVEHDGQRRQGGWRSPLIMARRNEHRAVVAYLLAKGPAEFDPAR